MSLPLDLFRHMLWADSSVWHAIESSEAAARDARTLSLLHHLHLVQFAFLRLWTRADLPTPKLEAFERPEDMIAWAKTYGPALRDYLDTVDDEAAQERLDVPWARYMEQRYGTPALESTLLESMLQVCFHSHYHRAQINARLRELGSEPPMVDYIGWVWLGRPVEAVIHNDAQD